MPHPRVLVVHNRYRIEGGEERSVELQLRALERAGAPVRDLQRRSSDAGQASAATALLRGGEAPGEVGAAVREHRADVAHFHNMQPLFGPRALEAARDAGARVVLHLHNLRLFCAIGVASRDGGPCFRCHHRLTLPGLVLNCRGSVPEAAVYAAALSLHQPRVIEAVDLFVVPSSYAKEQAALLGLPRERIEVLPHYLPADAFAERSGADRAEFALVAARLSQEKAVDRAVRAAAEAGVPLRIAGDGPARDELEALARGLSAPVEFLGRVDACDVRGLLARAAAVLMPSRYHEFSPFSALEAMAAGAPVLATSMGGLPELVGEERCLRRAAELPARLRSLWDDPDGRRAEGDALIERARERHAEEPYVERLLGLYEQVLNAAERPAAARYSRP